MLLFVLVALQAWQVWAGLSVKAQQWEYAIESPNDDELQGRLRALGMAGWEIISARRATGQVRGEKVASYEMILRRPVSVSDGLPPLPTADR